MEDTIVLLRNQISELRRECEMLKRTCANLQKEKQEEKQDSPHTPLQIKEENEKEKIDTHQRRNSEKFQKGRRCNVFVKPTLDEVQAYMDKVGEGRFTALYFWTYYDSREWKMGCRTMRNWKKVLDNWCERENNRARRLVSKPKAPQNIVTFKAYKPVDRTGTVSYEEYLRMKKSLTQG